MYNTPITHPLVGKLVDIDTRSKEFKQPYDSSNCQVIQKALVEKVSKNEQGEICVHVNTGMRVPWTADKIVKTYSGFEQFCLKINEQYSGEDFGPGVLRKFYEDGLTVQETIQELKSL